MSSCTCNGATFTVENLVYRERIGSCSTFFDISALAIGLFVILASRGLLPGGISESTLNILTYTAAGCIILRALIELVFCFEKPIWHKEEEKQSGLIVNEDA